MCCHALQCECSLLFSDQAQYSSSAVPEQDVSTHRRGQNSAAALACLKVQPKVPLKT